MSESREQLLLTYPIGSRIRLTDNSVGTLKYVGEVAGHQGIWLGIDWDDESRGKHDGSINNVAYFHARKPTTGSMVRPGKILKRESLRQAIEQRYILTPDDVLDAQLMADAQKMLHAAVFEIVGMDKIKEKQSHWDDLHIVAIEDSMVYMAGILTQLVSLTDLSLTNSLISSWGTIADILKQVPTLKYLNLSENILSTPSQDEIIEYRPHFQNLKSINLRKCNMLEWSQVLHVSQMWTNIETLALQENKLVDLPMPETCPVLSKLENLDLQQNRLTNFQEIINLGRLNALKYLNLSENLLTDIEFPDCDPMKWLNIFENLIEINLRENPIQDEVFTFNELDKLPKLEHIMFTSTAGFEQMFSNSVSRIGGLKMLNSMPLTDASIRGAEYDLWKAYANAWTEGTESDRFAISKICRAYPRLIQKYGLPEQISIAPKVSNLITIHIETQHASNDNAAIKKRVSRKMSVQALQGVALKLLSAAGHSGGTTLPQLSYLDRSRGDVKIPMDNPSKSLDYYSISEGDSVIVDW